MPQYIGHSLVVCMARLVNTHATPDLGFALVKHKKITDRFGDPAVSRDDGALYFGEVDRRVELTERLAEAIAVGRRQIHVDHTVIDLLRQRVFSARIAGDPGRLSTVIDEPTNYGQVSARIESARSCSLAFLRDAVG